MVSGAFASASHLGGELRVVFAAAAINDPALWAAFDPARAYDIWSVQPNRIVYDGLVALQYSGADPQVLVPDLADAVPAPTDGGRTYTFNLRPGIRYSDGTEVRASDIELGCAARCTAYQTISATGPLRRHRGRQACIDDRRPATSPWRGDGRCRGPSDLPPCGA